MTDTMQEINTFRMKFAPLFVFIVIFSTLLFSGMILVEDWTSINWIAYSVSLVIMLLLSATLTLLLKLYFKISIMNDGFRGFNFWGKYRHLKWNDISGVKPINFMGLKYLRVFSTTGGLPLWVPLFVNDMKLFSKQACTLPPEGNAFRDYYYKFFG